MVKWENLCISKDYGELGILNTRMMNEVLVGKCVWRMLKAGKDDMCYNLLKRKYLGMQSFLCNMKRRMVHSSRKG